MKAGQRAGLAIVLLASAGIATVPAASGHVIDPEGEPIVGASVCTIASPVERECVETDSEGFYRLPSDTADAVRVRADGYLIAKVRAVDREIPLALRRAAMLEATFLGPSGDAVTGASFYLSRPDGRRHGPMGPTNRSGVVIVSTLEPGEVVLTATAEGYEDSGGHRLNLVSGETARLTVAMEPADPAP